MSRIANPFLTALLALLILLITAVAIWHLPIAQAGAPDVSFDITPQGDYDHKLNYDNHTTVFYGDRLTLLGIANDPDGDSVVQYKWTFRVNETGNDLSTTSNKQYFDFTVGVDHLYSELNNSHPVMPPYNSEPVNYTLTFEAWDTTGAKGEHTEDITVYPYAEHIFNTTLNLSGNQLNASVDLVWRGFPNESAPSGDNVTPEKPVFVYINKTSSHNPNLKKDGGIGDVYSIETTGCYLQNGEKGIIKGDIWLPYLSSELEYFGNPSILKKDLRLEYYDDREKRYLVVEDSHAEVKNGVDYVTGTVNQVFRDYTIIVDSIYDMSNPNFNKILPELSVVDLKFSENPAHDSRELIISAKILNKGILNAHNVVVDFYDEDYHLGQNITEVKGNCSGMANLTITAHFFDPTSKIEGHIISVYVNKLRYIRERDGDYSNNTRSTHLFIVPNASLEIESISYTPQVPNPGEIVTVNLTLNSTGTRVVRNANVTVLLNNNTLRNFTIGEVEPGQIVNLSFNFTAGKTPMTITINVTYLYGEECLQRKIWVTHPNLKIDSLSLSKLNLDNGTNVTISIGLKNFGNASAKEITVRVFIDSRLNSTINLSAVEAGKTVNLTRIWNATPGNHTIKIEITYADGKDSIEKKYEFTKTAEAPKSGTPSKGKGSKFEIGGINGYMVLGGGALLVLIVASFLVVLQKKSGRKAADQPARNTGLSTESTATDKNTMQPADLTERKEFSHGTQMSSSIITQPVNPPVQMNPPQTPPLSVQRSGTQSHNLQSPAFNSGTGGLNSAAPAPPLGGKWICPVCGAHVDEKFIFCTNCGYKRH